MLYIYVYTYIYIFIYLSGQPGISVHPFLFFSFFSVPRAFDVFGDTRLPNRRGEDIYIANFNPIHIYMS